MVQSNDNANTVKPEDRYKYIDDLSVLQLVLLSGLLVDYNVRQHVAFGTDMKFLPSEKYSMQGHLDYISSWTDNNLMKLNEAKCNYLTKESGHLKHLK